MVGIIRKDKLANTNRKRIIKDSISAILCLSLVFAILDPFVYIIEISLLMYFIIGIIVGNT